MIGCQTHRNTDPDKIEDMIAAESDPKDRVFLLILNAINKSLIANTETIREVAQKLDLHIAKFETHSDEEEAMLNKGRGAWKVSAWFIGVVQVIGLTIWVDSRREIEAIHMDTRTNQIEHARIIQRLDALEKK